jgi:Spy/CpxP family protein refolding chaperone
MKKLLIITALFVGIITSGYAQDTTERKRPQGHGLHGQGFAQEMKTPEDRAKMSADALEKRLNLSQEQKDKVYALHLERGEKMEKLRKSEMDMRKSQMENRREIMNDSEKKMNKILNDEQQKTMEEMKQKGKERMKNRAEHRPGMRKG